MRSQTIKKHPSPVDISRALSAGADQNVLDHLASCPACAEELAALGAVDKLAQSLPDYPPSEALAESRLAAVLSATTPRKQAPGDRVKRESWTPWLWGGVAAAAAAALLVVVWTSRSNLDSKRTDSVAVTGADPVYRGSVRAEPGARFERESSSPHEVVRLYEGTITVDVTPLRAGESFRVIVGDGEVEVHGTTFDVVAKNDKLAAVQVVHGTVEVRPKRQAVAVLIAGQRWETEAKTETVDLIPLEDEVAETSAKKLSPPRSPAATGTPTPEVSEPVALAVDRPMARMFDLGWKQLGAGNTNEAAATFGEALELYPNDPLAEDAFFWRSVAFVRMKRSEQGAKSLAAFLGRYPRSPRAGEASAMLGWILLERNDIDQAEKRFRAVVDDPVKSVRASAQKGLDAVAAKRQE
jgi:TolA-binding protein